MTPEVYADQVLKLLDHGRANAIKSDDIANVLGIKSETNKTVRVIIRHLVEVCGYCIGSCSRGFYIIDDEADLELTTRDLHARAMAMLHREKVLKGNFSAERNYVLGVCK